MNIHEYSIALLTNMESNKNSTTVARELSKSQPTTSRFLNNLKLSEEYFTKDVKILFSNKKLNLIIDDFVLSKRYSNQIEGTSILKDQSTKTFTNGIKIVASGLTDGKLFLPLDLEQWIAQFIAKDLYLTKYQLAQKLILRTLELKLKISTFVLDGLYFCLNFINFLVDHSLKFLIKAKTTTSVKYKNQVMQLKDCPDLRLNSNQHQKKIKAIWNNQIYYFIAIRRTGKHGDKVIYLIANFETRTRNYRNIYDSRWCIEKFIRTGKQSLGLNDSSSQIAHIYLNHIRCVFKAYTILQLLVKKLKFDSPEQALRRVKTLKLEHSINYISDWISLLGSHA